MVRKHFQWNAWESLLASRGVTVDRPLRSTHPEWTEVIYPINYGYIPGTRGTDGEGIDVFVGSEPLGLVGLIITCDHRKGDQEFKLLYNCTPAEVYLAHGFINFNPARLCGKLVLRRPMHELWQRLANIEQGLA